jgi:histidine ammonia-lyase
MRSTPQVIGAAHDALAFARLQVEIELNGVGDNPVFSQRKIYSYQVQIFKHLQFRYLWIWQGQLLLW